MHVQVPAVKPLAGLEAQQVFNAQPVQRLAQWRAADFQLPGQCHFIEFFARLELVADGHGSKLDVDTVDGTVGYGAHEISGWCSRPRSEEHTSEIQSRENLVCCLLLEKENED